MSAIDFKRMVLGLPYSGADYEGIDTAAAMAESLGLDLLAAFIEDPSVLSLASRPLVRELRPLGAGWQHIDAARLGQELHQAADTARRRFFERVRTHNVGKRFQVARGPVSEMILSLVQPTDIVVVFEPKHPAERITRQVTELIEAAFTGASTVLVIPCRITRRYGPVVAVAAEPNDPSIKIGLAIASAAKEHLVILNASGRHLATGEEAPAATVHIEERMLREPPSDPRAIASMLASINERLLVTSLAPFRHGDLEAIASLRGVPVLVTGTKPTSTVDLEAKQERR